MTYYARLIALYVFSHNTTLLTVFMVSCNIWWLLDPGWLKPCLLAIKTLKLINVARKQAFLGGDSTIQAPFTLRCATSPTTSPGFLSPE